mmetsp:Transcript_29636/g.64688  ORF Transcript_29636/g.64688 Transcript_29636/m.64688 type:complete len:529 (+) Transcript_29636:241-1827(+)
MPFNAHHVEASLRNEVTVPGVLGRAPPNDLAARCDVLVQVGTEHPHVLFVCPVNMIHEDDLVVCALAKLLHVISGHVVNPIQHEAVVLLESLDVRLHQETRAALLGELAKKAGHVEVVLSGKVGSHSRAVEHSGDVLCDGAVVIADHVCLVPWDSQAGPHEDLVHTDLRYEPGDETREHVHEPHDEAVLPNLLLCLKGGGLAEPVHPTVQADELRKVEEEPDDVAHGTIEVEALLEIMQALPPEVLSPLAHERSKLGIEDMVDVGVLAFAEQLPHIIVREVTQSERLDFQEVALCRVHVHAIHGLCALERQVKSVAGATGEGEAHVALSRLQDRLIGAGILPRKGIQEGGGEQMGATVHPLCLSDVVCALLANPHVIGRLQERDVRQGTSTVVLPHAVQRVVQVVTTLGAQIDVVRVKDAAPEPALKGVHLPKSEIVLRRHVKIGNSEEAVVIKKGCRVVDRSVEGRDHGERIGESHEVSSLAAGKRVSARVAFNNLHIGPAVLAGLLRGNFAQGGAQVHHINLGKPL